jgi:hypothetical protein
MGMHVISGEEVDYSHALAAALTFKVHVGHLIFSQPLIHFSLTPTEMGVE